MYFFDTESIGFFGATILIQYSKGIDDPIILHNIFKEPAYNTITLIEDMMSTEIIGYNLVHDMMHLCRTYNILKLLPLSLIPTIEDIYEMENKSEAHDNYCLKPTGALDLMIHGRQTVFQQTMNQKDIVLKRVPRVLAKVLQGELNQLEINLLYFAKRKKEKENLWDIKELHSGTSEEVTPEERAKSIKGLLKLNVDSNFVNIRLHFSPSTSLKNIMKYILKKDVQEFESFNLPKPKEKSWHPSSGSWFDVAPAHLFHWRHNKLALKYAENDVQYLKDLYLYFDKPKCSKDSLLACMIGCLHWRGYSINLELAKTKYNELIARLREISLKVNVNAPQKVLKFLHEVCNPIEKILISDTSEPTLQAQSVVTQNIELKTRIKLILEGRKLYGECNLLKKLIIAKRLYITLKVIGTKSDRMAGGSLNKGTTSINPQGISKDSFIRSIITFALSRESLNGGDYKGFEICIADAHYQDPRLRELLLTGKSVHGVWGNMVYKLGYDEIMATKNIKDNEPNGYYGRSKKSFFAKLYCAFFDKLAEILKTNPTDVRAAEEYFDREFVVIAEKRKKTKEDLTMIYQPLSRGEVLYKIPNDKITSFLGFSRYFTLEFQIIKFLYDLSINPTSKMKEIGNNFTTKRRDKVQTGLGALQTAILAAAFQLQAYVQRAGINHEIQSPGARLTKDLESEIYTLQPSGIHEYYVAPLNIHDELMTPCKIGLEDKIEEIVNKYINEKKSIVPLLEMTWKKNIKNWSDK